MAQRKDIERAEMQGKKRDPNRNWTKEYAQSDVQHVLRVSHAHSWSDAIKYLDEKGMNDNELTPGETLSMKADLQKARKQGAKFTDDPQKAYKEIRGGGGAKASAQKKR